MKSGYLNKILAILSITVVGMSMTFGHAAETQVNVSILAGAITIGAPGTLSFSNTISISFDAQELEEHFTGTGSYFYLQDMKGHNSGYNTTIQLSGDLTSTGGTSIAASNIQFKATSTTVATMSGMTNTDVLISASAASYQSLDSARQWIYRTEAENSGRIGRYGQSIWLKISVPASQAGGNYAGTLVYTLIEN